MRKTLLTTAAAALIATAGMASAQNAQPNAEPKGSTQMKSDSPATNKSDSPAMNRPGASEKAAPATNAQSKPDADGKAKSATDTKSSSKTKVSLSTEQRTKIRTTVLQQSDAPRVSKVDFRVSVGTKVPRTVRAVALPTTVAEIYPQWSGHLYFIVGNEIVVVAPDTMEIVAVLSA